MTLCFVANPAELSRAESLGVLSGDVVVVTGHFDVLVAERSQGRDVIDLWDRIDPSEWSSLHSVAWRFCERLGEAIGGSLREGECDIGKACSRDLSWAVSTVLVTAFAAERALSWSGGARVLVFGDLSEADFHDPPESPPDAFHAAVIYTCKQMRVPVEVLASHRSRGERFFKSSTTAPGKRRLWRAIPRRARHVSLTEQLGAREQELMLGRVDRMLLGNWLAVSSEPVALNLPYVPLHAVRRLPLRQQTRVSDVREAVEFASRRVGEEFGRDLDPVLKNPHVEFIWTQWGKLLMDAAHYFRVGRFLALALRPDDFVIGYDVFGPARCFAEGLSARGARVISVDHVGFGLSEDCRWHQDAAPDLVTWGEADAEARRPFRRADSRVEPIGSLRSDHAALLDRMDDAPRRVASDNVVILTSHTCRGEKMYGWARPGDLIRSWESLAAIFNRHPDWQAVVKPHPRYDHHRFYASISSRFNRPMVVSSSPPAAALAEARVALLMNAPSTVVLDAVAAGVPVVYLKDCVFPWAASLIEGGCALVAESVEEAEGHISRLWSDDDLRSRIVAEQRQALRRVVAAWGENAAKRMLSLVGQSAGSSPAGVEHDRYNARRWILDLAAAIDGVQSGLLPFESFAREAGRLRVWGRQLDLSELDDVEIDQLGNVLLGFITWGNWSPAAPYPSSVLGRTYFALPTSMRPGLSALRDHLVHALLLEAGAPDARRWRQAWARFMACLLAPKRIANIIMSQLALANERTAIRSRA